MSTYLFDDENEELDLNESILVNNNTHDSDWSSNLEGIMKAFSQGSFRIVHININSITNKFHHIFKIINNTNCDLIFINETR